MRNCYEGSQKGHHLSQAVHQTITRVNKRGTTQPRRRKRSSFIITTSSRRCSGCHLVPLCLHLLLVLCLHRSHLPFPLILLLLQQLHLLRQEVKLGLCNLLSGCLGFIGRSLNCQVDLSLSQLVLQIHHFQGDLRWYCCHRRCHGPSFPAEVPMASCISGISRNQSGAASRRTATRGGKTLSLSMTCEPMCTSVPPWGCPLWEDMRGDPELRMIQGRMASNLLLDALMQRASEQVMICK